MTVTAVFNDSGLQAALAAVALKPGDLVQIEGAGAYILINGMRTRVAVDTGATKASTMSHITDSELSYIRDEVGPETVYAPNIEYGRQDMPNYPIQPFVRPTVEEDGPQAIAAMSTAFGTLVSERWPK